jgi:Caspase domain
MTGLLLGLFLAAAPIDSPAAIRRFALIVGANDGGAGRVQLHYAHSDAVAIDRVLRELGGLAEADRLLVLDPGRAELLAKFDQLRARLAGAQNTQREVIVYYSGHSDAEGLLLPGGDTLKYAELRGALEAIPAEVRIAILDSCGSGSFTRLKGGISRPSFLSDISSLARGHAFLTSSSGEEAAQESDQIGSSFFTHYLVSGLRGAADASGDGRITLLEAYQFAFRETLARTETTEAGAQHPGYAIDLVGTGDLVMTDLRNTSAGLRLGETLRGRIFVRDASGQLVAELHKAEGHAMELALAPGNYEVTLERDGRAYRAQLSVPLGAPLALEEQSLVLHELEPTRARGVGDSENPRRFAVDVSLVPPLSLDGALGGDVENAVQLAALVEGAAALRGVGVSGLVSYLWRAHRGVSATGLVNVVGGPTVGLQMAGLVDVSGGPLGGAQVAGLAAWANHGGEGFQTAGILDGVRGSFQGLQTAGVVNLVGGEFRGAQIAGVANQAGQVAGLQLALLNIGGSVRGAQIGVVNIASDVIGTQLGVVNVADSEEGAPIGVLSFIGNGRASADVWTGDSSAVNVGVKLGLKHFYTLLTASLDPGRPYRPWYAGGGFGWRHDFGRLFLTVEALTGVEGLSEQSPGPELAGSNTLSKLRVGVGWAFADRFALTAGLTGNIWVLWRAASNTPDLSYGLSSPLTPSNTQAQVRVWPSPYVGVEF